MAAFTSVRTTVLLACTGMANRTVVIASATAIGGLGRNGGNYDGNPCTVTAISPRGAMLGAVSTGDGDGVRHLRFSRISRPLIPPHAHRGPCGMRYLGPVLIGC